MAELECLRQRVTELEALRARERRFDALTGVRIAAVTPGTPAWQAGLRGARQVSAETAAVLQAVDGNPIKEPDDLFLYVSAALAGTRVTLRYRQDLKSWWRCTPHEYFVVDVEK